MSALESDTSVPQCRSTRRFSFLHRLHLRPVLLCTLLALLTACGASEDDADSGPTIDVKPGVEISTEDDVVEKRHNNQGLSGILPDDFPKDVPLSLPASLVDFGEENGDAYAEFATTKGRRAVEQSLLGLLQDSGWNLLESSAEGTADEMRLMKDLRPLRVVFRTTDAGLVYRVVY